MKIWFIRIIASAFILLSSWLPLAAHAADANLPQYCHAVLPDGTIRCVPADSGTCPSDTPSVKWGQPDNVSCKCGTNTPYPGDECVQLENPLKSEDTTLPEVIGIAIKAVLGVAGAVALLTFMLGGWHWVTAAGNAEKISSGTQSMIWSVLGLAVVFGSYLMVDLVISLIMGTGVGAPPK